MSTWAGGWIKTGRRAPGAFTSSVPAEWLREHIERNAMRSSLAQDTPEDWLDDLREKFGDEISAWREAEVLAGIREIAADALLG